MIYFGFNLPNIFLSEGQKGRAVKRRIANKPQLTAVKWKMTWKSSFFVSIIKSGLSCDICDLFFSFFNLPFYLDI